jgi:dolichyl-phosphate-mannose-protein mannosyltransferase
MPATAGDAGATATPRAEGPQPASPARHRVPVWWDWLALAAIVALFVGVAAYQIRLPGLYNDEAYDVVPAMQLVLGQPVELNRDVGLRLFGYDLPLMISDYQGATSAYGVLPLFALFGVGVETVRAFTIGVGALAIVLTYLFGRALFGRPAGLLAALLLATSPSFVFWSRVGVYVVCEVVPLALGAMLGYLRWRRSGVGRGLGWLALAAFLTGLGLSTKLLFLWFIGAALAAGAAVWLVDWRWPLDAAGRVLPHQPLRARLARRVALDWRPVGAALAGFLVGAGPILAYNLASGGTYRVLRANLFQTSKGANNLALVDNLATKAGNFRVLLEGSYFWFLGAVHANPVTLPIFLASAAGLVALVCAVPAYRLRYRAPAVAILAMLAAILVQSAFTLSALETTHLLLMFPLPQLTIAACAVLLGHTFAARLSHPGGRALRAAALLAPIVALVLPIAVMDLRVDARYHRALAESGGKSSFSDRIYELAAYLDRHGFTHPYALDWGMKYNVQLLTHGRVDPREIYGQEPTPPPSFYAALDRLLDDPDAIYIAHRDEGLGIPSAYPGRVAEFKRLAQERGKDVVPLKVIYEPGQVPLYYVYVARDP